MKVVAEFTTRSEIIIRLTKFLVKIIIIIILKGQVENINRNYRFHY